MDTVFLILSKIGWALIRPDTLLILGIALTFLATLRGRLRAARAWGGITLAAALAIAVLPVGHWTLRPLEARYPPAPALEAVDGIVVLGGAEMAGMTRRTGLPQTDEGGERFAEAVALARRFPDAPLMFTGGSGALRDIGQVTDAQAGVARVFFLRHGIEPRRILLETASRNTAENAAMSLSLAEPAPGARWVLVTSAWHMPRAMRSFARAGWPEMTAWPVDHRAAPYPRLLSWDFARQLELLGLAMRERVGLLAYGITGR